jgi:uncharacterized protein (DUF433 family)
MDYEHRALGQISWDTSAQVLARAADHILNAYKRDRAAAKPLRVVAEGSPGWHEANDSRLIPVYYMLMGLAVENYIKGIIMVNHPEYLTEDGLTKIDKHETYDLLNENGITEFKVYDDILHQLAEYVTSIGRFPVTKRIKDHKIVNEPINIGRLNRLLDDLYKRSIIERRLKIIRNKGETITFQGFKYAQKELIAFINPNVSMKDILDQYPKFSKNLIYHALDDYAKDITDKNEKNRLLIKMERWNLGYED